MTPKRLLLILSLFFFTGQACAALIVFNDRTEFENAVGTALAFEGFNQDMSDYIALDTGGRAPAYRTISSHVNEGSHALRIFEYDWFSVSFTHEVFAIGFDVNELNSGSLHYSDSSGHLIENALVVTEVWNESTFFGVISDVALSSFTLTGTSSATTTTYGFDALTYTAAVSSPSMIGLFLPVTLTVLVARARKRNKIR